MNWISKLKDENGKLEADRQKIIEIAANFYEKLYSSQLSCDDKEKLKIDLTEDQEIDEINLEEMELALGMMKNNKAVGDDEIPTELLKKCDTNTMKKLLKIFNEILETEEIPYQWLKSTIILFSRKETPKTTDLFRKLHICTSCS